MGELAGAGYLRESFAEGYGDDCLTVMGKGLGLPALFAKFVEHYSFRGGAGQVVSQRLVLCLNCGEIDAKVREGMKARGIDEENLPEIITNEVPSQDRADMYMLGGCYFITSRILIVDLLDDKLDASKVSGLLIYNAHRISETSLESFVIRVFRERNRTGFIKAFSEDAEQLVSGYMRAERLLRSLYLQRLALWPRFRLEVARALESRPQPEVSELSLPLTRNALGLQNAILVTMSTCLKELKKACPALDTSQWTLENGLFQHFDLAVRAQLDPEWHRTAFRTKQLVSDLTVLRRLLDYLVRYDAFSFHHVLSSIAAVSREQQHPSLWLTSAAAEEIFRFAQARLHRHVPWSRDGKVRRSACVQEIITNAAQALDLQRVLEPVAECPPKWRLLEEVAKEIHADFAVKTAAGVSCEETNCAGDSSNPGCILVVVRDDLSVSQLQDVLVHGTKHVADNRYRWFVSKRCRDILRRQQQSRKDPAIRLHRPGKAMDPAAAQDGDVGNMDWSDQAVQRALEEALHEGAAEAEEVARAGPVKAEAGSGFLGLGLEEPQLRALSEDQQLLLLQGKLLKAIPPEPSLRAAALHASNGTVLRPSGERNTFILGRNDAPGGPSASVSGRRKRKRAGDCKVVELHRRPHDVFSHTVVLTPELTTAEVGSALRGIVMDDLVVEGAPDGSGRDEDDDENEEEEDGAAAEAARERSRAAVRAHVGAHELHAVILTHAQLKDDYLAALNQVRPSYVILYDADPYIVRSVEVYQASLARRVKVFFFMYEGSTEEHRYTAALVKEKRAFESLILAKEHMVISLPDHPLDLRREQAEDLALVADSRQRRSLAQAGPGGRAIVVDVREFRSALPSTLYACGYYAQLLPRTLWVGDYVLSPEICVERKGISDLFQSFASGRLYNQCEAMSRHYRLPCVLIEFQPDKPFCLVAPADIPSEIRTHSITSNLVLLAQSFPGVRLLWSRSPQSTADIFRAIALHHDPVDVQKAVAVGAGLEDQAGDEDWLEAGDRGPDEDNENARQAAIRMLLALPGVNAHNYREVMHHVESLADLAAMSEGQLAPIVGQANAVKLASFFRQRIM